MKLILGLTILTLSLNAFSLGTIHLTPELKSKYETQFKNALRLNHVELQVQRLTTDGMRNFHFKLGQLSRSEFESLKSQLAFPMNSEALPLQFAPGKLYTLKDFLLPKIQASLGKVIATTEEVPWMQDLSGSNEILVETNCWSTGFDILRSVNDPFISFLYIHPDEDAMTRLLKDSRFSKAVQLNSLKTYDFVLYYSKDKNGKYLLDHVAIALGGGLAFQKTGNSEVDFYNIEPLDEISDQRKNLNPDKNLTIEYRRLTAPFPHPYKLWGAKAKGLLSDEQTKNIPEEFVDQVTIDKGFEDYLQYGRIRPLRIVKNKNSEFSFDAKDPLSSQFRIPPFIGSLEKGTIGYADHALKVKTCTVEDEISVRASEFSEPDSLKVEVIPYSEENASCLTSDGKKQKTFWIQQDRL